MHRHPQTIKSVYPPPARTRQRTERRQFFVIFLTQFLLPECPKGCTTDEAENNFAQNLGKHEIQRIGTNLLSPKAFCKILLKRSE